MKMLVLGMWLVAAQAAAQSQVALFGVLDVGLERVNHLVPDNGAQTRVSSGGESSVRFGLRGREELGGGLRAVFLLEGGINIDDGSSAQGGRLFGRTSMVGLESDRFGSLTAGRQQNMALDFAILFDPVGRSSKYSTNSLDLGYVSRSDNTVKYIGKFGPLQAHAMAGFKGSGAASRNRYGGALASHQFDAFKLGLGVEHVTTSIAGIDSTIRRNMVGASYAISSASKLAAAHTWRSDHSGGKVARIGQSWVGYQTTARPNWFIAGTLYMADFEGSGDDPKNLTLLLAYYLSRRTDIYLTLGRSWNKGQSNMGVFSYGTVMRGENQTGVSAGLCHAF